MRLVTIAILAAAGVALAAATADAATKKRSQAARAQPVEVLPGVRGEAGVTVQRARTRVIVTKRSYLDPGTTVFPGSLSSRDYVAPPNMRGPMDMYLPPDSARDALPHPWWLGAYHAPHWMY
jgi:hypothetical protein